MPNGETESPLSECRNGLKSRFQTCRMQQTQCTQCMHTKNATHAKNRINCMCCFSHACVAYFGFLIASQPCTRCVACVAYRNLETACRPTKTDLKVGFQAAVRNATDATHAGHVTQIKKPATYAIHAHKKCNRDRIGCVLREFRISVF